MASRTPAGHALARLALAGALLALLATATAACGLAGGGGDAAVLASPDALWASPAEYEGRLVRTTGTVRGVAVGAPDEHYVVEDAAPHRVELRGVDHARLAAMEGRTVEVVGRFHFSETSGYAIDVRSIDVVG